MSKTITEVLNLCTEFNENVEKAVRNDKNKQHKAEKAVAPYLEELNNITQEISSIVMMSMVAGKVEDLENNEKFQNLTFKAFDIMAIVYAEIFDQNEVDAAMPASLKDESVVEILQKRGAENLAKLIKC